MYGIWNTSVVGDFDPDDYFGFVYLIEHKETKRAYIGKKQLKSRRRHKVAGRKNRKVVIKESDWKTYTSSSEELNEEIGQVGIDSYKFVVLKLCKTKRELGYSEVKEQFERNVLDAVLPDGSRAYYNKNIMSRWFVTPIATKKRWANAKTEKA